MPRTGTSKEPAAREPESRLILITQGRDTGRSEAALLAYRRFDNDYVVVATEDGNDEGPDWYLNLKAEPVVQVEMGDACFHAKASMPTTRARMRLQRLVREMTGGKDMKAILLTPLP